MWMRTIISIEHTKHPITPSHIAYLIPNLDLANKYTIKTPILINDRTKIKSHMPLLDIK
jgi:hypothetical protein